MKSYGKTLVWGAEPLLTAAYLERALCVGFTPGQS
jgi:hypothetical protein